MSDPNRGWKLYDTNGKVVLQSGEYNLDEFLEDTPTNGETSKAPTSNWAYDHENGSDPHTVYPLDTEVIKKDGSVAFTGNESMGDNHLTAVKSLKLTATSELTLDTNGAIVPTQTLHTVDTYADAASDNLDTITNTNSLSWVVLRAEIGTRTVVIRHNQGNIWLQGGTDVNLDDLEDGILLFWDSVNSKWFDIAAGGMSFAAPTVALGAAAVEGAATTVIRSDSTIAAFDATAPSTQAFADSAVVGTVAFAARRDHKHAMMADPVTAHVAAADPHTGYVKHSLATATSDFLVGTVGAWVKKTLAETITILRTSLDTIYEAIGAAAAAIATHVAAGDPHTGYRLESADHTHASTGAQAGQLDHGLALTGLTDDDHSQYILVAGTRAFTGDQSLGNNALTNVKKLDFSNFASATIASGVVTVTQSCMVIDTEGGVSDDNLDTISGGTEGMVLYLKTANAGRDVHLKHLTGNIYCPNGQDVLMDNTYQMVSLVHDGTYFVVQAPFSTVDISAKVYFDDSQSIPNNTMTTLNFCLETYDSAGLFTVTVLEDCEDAWNEQVVANVTASADNTVYKYGTYSAKFVVADAFVTGVIGSESMASTNLTSYTHVIAWVRSSVALNAADYQLLLGEQANCVGPVETLNIPALAANTWTRVILTLANPASDDAIISIGLKQAVDKGAMSFYIDDVRVVTNPSRLTAPIAGKYDLTAGFFWAGNATGQRQGYMRKNGTDYIGVSVVGTGSAIYHAHSLATQINMVAGDYIELQVYQDSGGALSSLYGAYYAPIFTMARLPG